ncbi:hypothetical protein HNQ93_004254 [Hymenobacter luteus]|uniref:NERD domain-containing protein n=2 Tax=Hymenobacter TaxID=89966 RepID=A0A7W9T4H4_9BACT|nr:hypothetical protein [Hymenobacter latericoloratus]MBB6061375.1 hypothetical protein [Hymenobacter luteus]
METQDKGLQGEEFVNELAYSSLLKFWCYPGPKDERGDKKEIADLLILFKNTLLILSVKNYEFKGQYDRYFRRTLDKAASQIYGAERKLLASKHEVFIKHPDREQEQVIPAEYRGSTRVGTKTNAKEIWLGVPPNWQDRATGATPRRQCGPAS